ncbi:glycosyltransferase family 2 protein [Virgibacillus sp. MG-45]|uniref:glycosyltransferase family 2 protein n=1 Tax=Virgibacillus sp. MG-45 TaxID=3102791 RepID=UPI002ED80EF9
MQPNKLVSIIVPVYNAEQQLTHCITSILQQTYPHIEIILVDDGSTDNSLKICYSFSRLDPRVIVIHQANAGPSTARNNGIKKASGDYIQFVDADDYIDRDMTETLIKHISSDTPFVICGYRSLQKGKRSLMHTNYIPPLDGSFSKAEFLQQFGMLYTKLLLHSPCNKLYQTRNLKSSAIQFQKGLQRGEDLLFNLDYIRTCEAMYLISKPLYNYVISQDDTLSRSFNNSLMDNQKYLYSCVKQFLIEHQVFHGANKKYVEQSYMNSIVKCLNNVFHPASNYSTEEKKAQITNILEEIPEDKLRYYSGGVQARLMKFFIRKHSTQGIYVFFKAKHFLKSRMLPLFYLLKRLNLKEEKNSKGNLQ